MDLAICGGMHFTIDKFRLCFCIIAAFMWCMTLLFSIEYMEHHDNKLRYYIFMILTGIATVGVFLSADFYTLFIFFEIMSFTSYVWVAQEETTEALKAAKTYLAVAVIGGLVMLMGIFLLYHFGTEYSSDMTFAIGCLMLFGFGAKAGAFPLHIWLPKAHPVAPAPASALLSGILTKTGVFGIILVTTKMFAGNSIWGELILFLGTVTMLLGAVLGVFSIDLKRTLACSSMSQIGFILVGIGCFNFSGAHLHMVNHSLIKLLLFMVAGAIYMKTHTLNLNDLRGYGRKKPFLHFLYLTGALTIMGIPGFGGYVSKTLLHEGLVEEGQKLIEWIFLFSGGLTIAYCTKLYVAIFIQKNKDEKLQEKYDGLESMNLLSKVVLGLSAIVLLIWGRVGIMAKVCAFEDISHIRFFSWENLKGALISIIIGGLVYCLIYKLSKTYKNYWPKQLDLENLFYRPLLLQFLPIFCGIWCRLFDSLADGIIVFLRKTIYKDAAIPHVRLEGTFLTDFFGKIVNGFNRIVYVFVNLNVFDSIISDKRREKAGLKLKKDYVHAFATSHENHKEDLMIIERSLSFGLLMFCIGLTLTLVYLIFF